MIITQYTAPGTSTTVNLDRRVLYLDYNALDRNSARWQVAGTILEDISTFTSVGPYGPDMLIVDLRKRYGPGMIINRCRVGDQARRVTVYKVDDEYTGNNNKIPKDLYDGSSIIYVIKPDADRIYNELTHIIENDLK